MMLHKPDMNKTTQGQFKAPIEKAIGLNISRLLRTGRASDAISYIEEGKKAGIASFEHEFIDYLYKRAQSLVTQTAVKSEAYFSLTDLKTKLSYSIASSFRERVMQKNDHKYYSSNEISNDQLLDRILKAKSVTEQAEILPYKGKIYLPTDRYSESDQIEAIKKTAAFLSSVNVSATRHRLQSLRHLIRESGLTECLVVANGPSLKSTNLAMLDGMFVIGLNSIFLHPYITPHVIVCEDHLVGEDRSKELNGEDRSIKVIPGYLSYCIIPDDLTIVLNHRPRRSFPVDIDFSDNADKITFTGGTVTYTALQLAVSLGFKEVYLVGCDASYKVENVKEQNDYATGILESLGDDPNHFNSSYFGKGYRWHDPNALRMMQAYSVANRYAEANGVSITNITRGGMLEVFRREDFMNIAYRRYSKVCIIDWIDINSKAATGEVKKALFKDWPKDKLIHIYSPKPTEIGAFKSSLGDIFTPEHTTVLPAWKAIIENNPCNFYWRPTHNRPVLNLFAVLLFAIEKKPYALHLMDYWTAKVQDIELRSAYEEALKHSIEKSSHLFVISQRMKNRLCAKHSLPSEHVTVAHNYSPSSYPCSHIRRENDCKQRTIFYSGNLDPDQSIEPLIDICEAIRILNTIKSAPYRLIIRTSESHLKASGKFFADFDFVDLQVQSDTFVEYINQLTQADVCILCYGFGAGSQAYLLDSMANKLPDMVTAKSKFFAYGDSEVGTLNYLKTIEYPFIEFERDHRTIAECIDTIASMDYAVYAEVCAKALSAINSEFSEMAQCHVFQQQLAACQSIEVSGDNRGGDLLSLVDHYQRILKLSNVCLPKGLEDEFRLIQFLANHQELVRPVYKLVKEHGLTWSVNTTKAILDKAVKNYAYDEGLATQSIAWMIASLRHPRYSELWQNLFSLIVDA